MALPRAFKHDGKRAVLMAVALNLLNFIVAFDIYQMDTDELAAASAVIDSTIVAFFYFTN